MRHFPEPFLDEVLDFVYFLKTKIIKVGNLKIEKLNKVIEKAFEIIRRGSY